MTLRNKNKTTKKQLKKEDVLHYLSENPNFISDNIDLFNKIFSLNLMIFLIFHLLPIIQYFTVEVFYLKVFISIFLPFLSV